MSLALRLPRKIYLCRSSSNVPRLPSFLEMLQNPHVLFTFDKVHNPLCLPRKTTLQRPRVARECGVLYILTSKCASRHNGCTFPISQLPKVLQTRQFLTLLTWKCASRHNGVHFFDISTSKSGPFSHLASWLRTPRFSEPTFRPSGATNHWKKHSVSRFSYLFAHLDLLSSGTFSFWSSFFFSSLIWLFPSLLFICPYCRKFDF